MQPAHYNTSFTMKKLLLTALTMLFTATLQAQTVSGVSLVPLPKADKQASVRIGIRAGLNFARLPNPYTDFDARTTFHAGATINIPLVNFGSPSFNQGVDVITGLFIHGKGTSYEYHEDDFNVKETASPLYLQLPILVSYRFKPCNIMQLQLDFGSYFAYGIGGKYKIERRVKNTTVSMETDFFDENEAFRRADWGLHFGFGMTFVRHYHLGVSYEIGLSDIRHKRFESGSGGRCNGVWSLTFGYDF